MRYSFTIFLLWAAFLLSGQSIVISEISQGTSGNKEYVELLVTDSNTCGLDLRGYIIDDNNGYFGGGTGHGITDGCVRFANDPLWSDVPVGTLITIFNDAALSSPPFPVVDTSLSDGNCAIVVPISSTLFEKHTTQPSVSSGPAYPTTGWVSGGNWSDIQMSNNYDSFQIREANGTSPPIHAISWGNSTPTNTIISFVGSAVGIVFYFDNSLGNGDYLDHNNFTSASASTNETPSVANSANHAVYLNNIRGTCSDSLNLSVSSSTPPTCSSSGISDHQCKRWPVTIPHYIAA